MASSAEYFQKNLRRFRRDRGEFLTQEELADQTGFHRNFIGMLERGERKPFLHTLDNLADVLGVEPYELIMPPEQVSDD